MREIRARNRVFAAGRAHVESYGGDAVVVYAPEDGRHGNFYDAAYRAIEARPEWKRRLGKVHTLGHRSLPKAESGRRWCELDSSTSSDALLMNMFCTPGVAESAAVRRALGITGEGLPEFGWRAKVPLKSGKLDRTEVDMRWGGLLVEAKLTEADFQARAAGVVEGYRDFDAVFERELLPRIAARVGRRKEAEEFPEEYSQEAEGFADPTGFEREILPEPGVDAAVVAQMVAAVRTEARMAAPGATEARYASYQLIRNVLAAYAEGCSFCVLHDERRPDLREAWFRVMRAVKSAEMRVRCQVMTWQELARLLPGELKGFLELKYGIAD